MRFQVDYWRLARLRAVHARLHENSRCQMRATCRQGRAGHRRDRGRLLPRTEAEGD